jgi:iron-sulfur cluster assembly protein
MKRKNGSALMESAVSNLIKVSEEAKKKLIEINGDKRMLRVAVVGKSCRGLQYDMGWDEQAEGDNIVSLDGLTVIVDKNSAKLMNNVEIDFITTPEGSGFAFRDANVAGCGSCGTPCS